MPSIDRNLYERCVACAGTGIDQSTAVDYWKPVDTASSVLHNPCPGCRGKGFVQTGLTAGLVERLTKDRDVLLAACKLARRALSDLNGRVTREVWNGLYETDESLDRAIAKAEGRSDG